MNKWKEYIDKEIGSMMKPNKTMQLVSTSIAGNVYQKMKDAIAISEILTLATHMRAKIRLPDETLVPVNGISFIIASSGASKDRSLNQARKCFSSIYGKMDVYLSEQAIKQAVKDAQEAGRDESDYMEFYKKPRPLFGGAKPTVSGIQGHLNQLQTADVGGGHIYSGEFGSELANSNAMLDILQIAAELYDLGNMKADWRKTEEAQGKEITSMNFSAIFISSPGNIIYDQTVKKKFIVEFTTKLARRSFFNFNHGELEMKDETVPELMAREAKELKDSLEAMASLKVMLDEILPKKSNIIRLEDGVWELYGVVKRYYEEYAESIDPELESYKIATAHTQWRVLKLAGAFAQVENSTVLTKKHFAEALHYCQSTELDLKLFNEEINKESYELLDDYISSIYKDHLIELTAHKLSKLGYIDSISSVKSKLQTLVDMANDISTGLYSTEGTRIKFEKLVHKNVVGASFMVVSGDKAERAKKCSEGYTYQEIPFLKLGNLLSKDTVFSTFEFKDGIRSNDNVVGGTKWVVLDVDESDITASEAHDMLDGINHHIATTSNKDNSFKFRVILELDSYVTVDNRKWKKFMESISNEVGITADLLPKSQIYFGYKDRVVMSCIDGDMINTKEHMLYANKEVTPVPRRTKTQEASMLKDSLTTFFYAYEHEAYSGSSSMLIRAGKHAKDLGATEEQVVNLLDSIQEYWVEPLEEERYQRTVVSQVKRWFE